jgi:hypothetical protein
MTKSLLPPDRPQDDPAFEDEVRAMLARRAADVLPTSAASRAELPGVVPVTVPRGPGRDGRRRLVVAAAAVVVVAGVAAYAATLHPGAPTTQTSAAQETDPPIVWPLDDHVPADVLASPETAAGAYLSEVLELIDLSTLEPPVVDGATATVGYSLAGLQGEVALRLDGDRWGVTGATNDAVDVDLAYAADGDVIAQLTFGPAARSGMRLHLRAVTDDGAPADDVVSVFEYVDGGEITVAPPPPADGAAPPGREADQVVLLPMDPSLEHSQPMLAIILDAANTDHLAAVRLDTLVDDDADPATPDIVIGHATRALTAPPPGAVDGPSSAAPAPTTAVPAEAEAGGSPSDDAARPDDALFVGSGTAAEVAQAYLDDRLPERPDGLRLVPGAGSEQGTGAGEIADIPWEIVGGSDIDGRYSGLIRLRSDPGGWSVIAASTDQISLTVRRADGAVGVTVAWVDPGAYDSVDVDLLDADGFPVTDGEIVSWPTAGEETLVAADEGVDPSEVRSVRVRHVGGTWFSLTEVPVPEFVSTSTSTSTAG